MVEYGANATIQLAINLQFTYGRAIANAAANENSVKICY